MTGNDDENVSDTFEALAEFAHELARQLVGLAPQHLVGKLQRQRGAPGARAEDGYWL